MVIRVGIYLLSLAIPMNVLRAYSPAWLAGRPEVPFLGCNEKAPRRAL